MKNLRKFYATTVLTLVLIIPAFAGEIQAPGATATGDMPTPGAAAVDPVTEAVLSLVQGLMLLF